MPVARALSVVYVLATRGLNASQKAAFDNALAGRTIEDTWGMTPDAEAGQAAFMSALGG